MKTWNSFEYGLKTRRLRERILIGRTLFEPSLRRAMRHVTVISANARRDWRYRIHALPTFRANFSNYNTQIWIDWNRKNTRNKIFYSLSLFDRTKYPFCTQLEFRYSILKCQMSPFCSNWLIYLFLIQR